MDCVILTQKIYLNATLFFVCVCALFIRKINPEVKKKAYLISYCLKQLVDSTANMKISNSKVDLVPEYGKS